MRVFRCWALCAASMIATACGERPPLCPDAHFDGEIPVAAASVMMFPQIQITARTTSDAAGVSVDIVDGRGTVSYEGRREIPAFIFSAIGWDLIDRTLYAGLGVADGVWYPFWLYCSDDGRLTDFDGEMTDRDVAVLAHVQGTCIAGGVKTGLLEIPAHSLRNVALTCGFTVTAPAGARPIDLGGSRPGTADFATGSAIVLPFHTADCRETCGDPGWYEVHAIVADPNHQTAAFAVYYLFGNRDGVFATNGFQLPIAAPYGDTYAGAEWTLVR
jgi:hypothetical protein